MGIIPVPPDYGSDCDLCYSAGLTPGYVKVFISGVIAGTLGYPHYAALMNGYHDMIQTPGVPCHFSGFRVGLYGGFVDWTPGRSDLWIKVDPTVYGFKSTVMENCARCFSNQIHGLPSDHYRDGFGFITTPAEMQSLIEMVTPIVGPDPRMELFPMADGEIVLKFCNIQDGTNIKIKLDTALL